MNLLCIHSDKFSYSPKYEAPKTEISFKDKTIRKPKYFNCLVIWITIDKDDKIEQKHEKLKKEIVKVVTDLNVKTVVLMPVSHLLPTPMPSKLALDWLLLLREELDVNSDFSCYLEPFGFIGNWTLSSKSHKRSVLGRWI